MFLYLTIFCFFLVFFLINKFFIKLNYIPNYTGQKHQKFIGYKKIPLSGGIFLILLSLFLFHFYDYIFCAFLLSIFIIGFLSDINYLNAPRLRLLLQLIVISFFVFILDIKIISTNIILLDLLLNFPNFKYFFSIFCLLILINGSNFIDGLNGLMIGYFTMIIILIFISGYHELIDLNQTLIINFILVLIFLFFMNINEKLFMGDSGAYVLSIICGYFLIKINLYNQEISPFYIVLLLWYPCFENLFSIIRKFILKRSPMFADNNHLHQLIFFILKAKIKSKKINSNNLVSFLILFYNLVIFTIGTLKSDDTQLQILLIMINIIIYLMIYFKTFAIKYRVRIY
jgi:UDP-N-acetylmuramyl pentapeptide phosphotransferase/UDP-N-acetylglucosamine-1-phosphate transferase